MGKGDKRRPCQISRDEYAKRYEDAFGPRTRHRAVMSEAERLEFEAEKARLVREIEEKANEESK